MTANEVLSMYEHLAGLSAQMAVAAKAGDINTLTRLENQCALQGSAAGDVTPMAGAARLRKIALLKQIMANDRAIRAVTEPWQLADALAHH